MLLDAHAALSPEFADALLVLVPRHPQRFESVANLLARRGIAFDRRSFAAAVRPESRCCWSTRVGELAALYAAADVAFVGGSLVPVGGHNLLEPAALGVPVITGPYNANSKDIARLLMRGGRGGGSRGRARRLQRRVAPAVRRSRPAAAHAARWAREFVEAHRGSVARLIELIDPLLKASAPAEPQPAAESLSRPLSRFKLCSVSMPAACCSLSTLTM